MVLPPSKQRSIQELYSQGTRVADICKKVHADRKTVNKYLGLSTQTPSFQQIERKPSIPIYNRPERQFHFHDNGNRFLDPEIQALNEHYTREEKQQRDARHHRRESNSHRQPIPTRDDNYFDLKYAHPLRAETPLPPEPLNVYEQELANLRNRRGIPISRPQPFIPQLPTLDDEQKAHDKLMAKMRQAHNERMAELNLSLILIEANAQKAREGDMYEWDSNQNKNNEHQVTKQQFQQIFHEVKINQPKPTKKTFELMDKMGADSIASAKRTQTHKNNMELIEGVVKGGAPLLGQAVQFILSKFLNGKRVLQAKVIK